MKFCLFFYPNPWCLLSVWSTVLFCLHTANSGPGFPLVCCQQCNSAERKLALSSPCLGSATQTAAAARHSLCPLETGKRHPTEFPAWCHPVCENNSLPDLESPQVCLRAGPPQGRYGGPCRPCWAPQRGLPRAAAAIWWQWGCSPPGPWPPAASSWSS